MLNMAIKLYYYYHEVTDLVHGGLVPGSVDSQVGHEERQTTGESLGACEATVGRPGEGGEPHVEVSEVLGALGPQHLQHTDVTHRRHVTDVTSQTSHTDVTRRRHTRTSHTDVAHGRRTLIVENICLFL